MKEIDKINALVYIGIIDIGFLILNTIYHFIIHRFYNTPIGKLFLFIFIGIIILSILIMDPQNNFKNDLSLFLLTALMTSITVFLFGVMIASITISIPIFLIIEWLVPPIILILICILSDS